MEKKNTLSCICVSLFAWETTSPWHVHLFFNMWYLQKIDNLVPKLTQFSVKKQKQMHDHDLLALNTPGWA